MGGRQGYGYGLPYFNADPFPAFQLNADTDSASTIIRIRIQFFTLMRMRFRIRILLLIKVMGIFGHWSIDPPGLHLSLKASIVIVYGPSCLHFESQKLLT
jgi:hypothetical protein